MSRRIARQLPDWLVNAALVVFTGFVLFPFYWLFASALKTPDQLFQIPPLWVPTPPTFDNFERLMQGAFPAWFKNSIVVALATTALGLTLAALAAYSFSRFPFRGNRPLSTMFLFIQLFPVAVIIIPLFILWSDLKLTNTY